MLSILVLGPYSQFPIVAKAYGFARRKYGRMRRKDGTWAFDHAVRVARIVAEYPNASPLLIAVALMHDLVEDTGVTLEEIGKEFGPNTASPVGALTKSPDATLCPDLADQLLHDQLQTAAVKDPVLVLVKLADRLDNARDTQGLQPEKRVRLAKQTREIFVPLADLYGYRLIADELECITGTFLNSN